MGDSEEIKSLNMENSETTLIQLRTDWYQTEVQVIMNIYLKNAKQEDVKIEFYDKKVCVCISQSSSLIYNREVILNHLIKPEDCSYKLFSTKIEVKMRKRDGYFWNSLEDSGMEANLKIADVKMTPVQNLPSYPSSCLKKFDWDKIEQSVIKDEEKEKPEGDAALNQLFQRIYGDGSDEVKKAMNKSFSESGGTVLSTNWGEVKAKKCDVKAPDGMEHKNWEQ